MPKHVIPKETGSEQLGIIHPLPPEVQRKAALNTAYRLERLPEDTTHADVLQVLQAVGLAPYEPAPAKVNPTTGQTEYASTEDAKARARVRKQAWRLAKAVSEQDRKGEAS